MPAPRCLASLRSPRRQPSPHLSAHIHPPQAAFTWLRLTTSAPLRCVCPQPALQPCPCQTSPPLRCVSPSVLTCHQRPHLPLSQSLPPLTATYCPQQPLPPSHGRDLLSFRGCVHLSPCVWSPFNPCHLLSQPCPPQSPSPPLTAMSPLIALTSPASPPFLTQGPCLPPFPKEGGRNWGVPVSEHTPPFTRGCLVGCD